jgi:hypothetical protein
LAKQKVKMASFVSRTSFGYANRGTNVKASVLLPQVLTSRLVDGFFSGSSKAMKYYLRQSSLGSSRGIDRSSRHEANAEIF